MKKILTFLTISASVFLLASCDKPAPTQLIDDTNNDYEVELLNKDLENQYYTSGSDTSGITQDITRITNLISVSGVKITNAIGTKHFSLAQAMFFDKSKPINYSDGRLLAYQTFLPGTIKFNGTQSNIVPYKIRFRDKGMQEDTLIGWKYVLLNLHNGQPDPFYFNYDASVSFAFEPFIGGNNLSFNILTPKEITGRVTLTGKRMNHNLEVELNWNSGKTKKISVIVGLIRPGQLFSIPLYKFRTFDDGEMIIPSRLLNKIPLDRFEKIVFTFVRSYEIYQGAGNNEMLVSSQSIHSIVIDIP